MPILAGTLSARFWRVTESLPPHFTEVFDRNLRRHAFRPVDLGKGEIRSHGWVNIRQILDAEMTLKKAHFNNVLALAMRIDRISVPPRLLKATLSQEIGKVLREKKVERLSDEQRQAVEDKVRQDLMSRQSPSTSVYEMAWRLDEGLVAFAASGQKINQDFSELFSQTFNLSLEPQFPFTRAQKWAKKQKMERELLEALPAPFSPKAPSEVIEPESGEE